MTVAHKNLTGTDLHILKGAGSATAGQVPVSDGAGDTTFAKLTHSSLQTTGNPFGAQLWHGREQTNDTPSPTALVGNAVWHKRVLNTTVTNEVGASSISSGQVTLLAGTYHARGWAFFRANGAALYHRLRFRNMTDTATLLVGPVCPIVASSTASAEGGMTLVEGRFTLSGTKTIELQHYIIGTTGSQSFGDASGSDSEVDIFAEAFFWKLT